MTRLIALILGTASVLGFFMYARPDHPFYMAVCTAGFITCVVVFVSATTDPVKRRDRQVMAGVVARRIAYLLFVIFLVGACHSIASGDIAGSTPFVVGSTVTVLALAARR